jgi:hypothetical protein
MTDVTDAEAAEVLWASSEQGKAAVQAGWKRAEAIGARVYLVEVGAIVYAAYLAAGQDAEPMEDGEAAPAEDEPKPAHLHSWAVLSVQPHTPWMPFGKPIPHTIALVRCSACGEPDARRLPGEWTAKDLERGG